MAASLASRLAATLPTTQTSAPAASTPQTAKETIPKSLAHAVDVEAEIPLESVQIDGLVRPLQTLVWLSSNPPSKVITKIIKHGRDAQNSNTTGVLLGIDLQGVLEVSNSFPLPAKGGAGEDEGGGQSRALTLNSEAVYFLTLVFL